MLYNLKNPIEKDRLLASIQKFIQEGACIELKRKHPGRTLSQNSYLHLLLGYFASEFGYSLEEVKLDLFKRGCNKDLFERTRINRRGREVTFFRSSAVLDTQEMSLAIERFRNFSSAECGLYLPEPNEHEAIFFAEQQVEAYKEYL